jgi:hypothetical protein
LREGQTVTIGGVTPKKLKFRNPQPGNGPFVFTILAKGKVCRALPGFIVVFDPLSGLAGQFNCNLQCPD